MVRLFLDFIDVCALDAGIDEHDYNLLYDTVAGVGLQRPASYPRFST